jgi:peptidylprolyl isomerase
MLMLRLIAVAALLVSFVPALAAPAAAQGLPAGADPQNTLLIDTTQGRIVIKLHNDIAPGHAARLKQLVREKFYDNVPFHRVIPGFMAQTGCPLGTGTGGSGTKLRAEFNAEPHVRGICSMARAQDPDSADSQFFIVYETAPHLDRQYTVWGKVVSGMELIDAVKKGALGSGTVQDPDKIKSLSVAADIEGAKA